MIFVMTVVNDGVTVITTMKQLFVIMMRIAELTEVIKGFTIMLVLLIHSIAVAAIKTF